MMWAYVTTSAIVLFTLLTGSATQNPADRNQVAPAIQIDHIIVAISDLEVGIREVERITGIQPVYGGNHPGGGTQNALIALGPEQYLEILAPQPDIELPESLDWLLQTSELTPVGWASSTTNIADTLELLRSNGYEMSTPVPGSRARPDGITLTWVTMSIVDPQIAGAPFFIEWGDAAAHPAKTSPAGCRLRSLTVSSPEEAALGRLIEVLGLDVVVGSGNAPEAALQIVLDCPTGTVVLK